MYIVEGNIGAGKSTFLSLLAKHRTSFSVVLEPLNKWQDTQTGNNLLGNFYHEPKRWAYTLETLTLINRVKEHIYWQNQNVAKLVLERSIYSGNYCFAQNGHDQNFLSPVEWQIYTHWFNFLTENKCKAPRGFIYLKIDPENAFERIKKRNRESERDITLEYLKQIHQKHELLFGLNKLFIPSISLTPILVIDCTQEFESNAAVMHDHIRNVEQFIASTQQKFKPATTDWKMLRRGAIDDNEDNVNYI